MRDVVSAAEATRRLLTLFPREAFDSVMSSPLAGAAIAAMVYVDSVATDDDTLTFWSRPSTVTWMSEEMRAHNTPDERLEWRLASTKTNKKLAEVLDRWGVPSAGGYADNSRETLRDETFRKWRESGAIRERAGVPKNSSKGRWALEPHFADLFDPAVEDADFIDAAEKWRSHHLSPAAKLRVRFAAQGQQADHAVTVQLPNNAGSRTLEAGRASLILKAVIEDWALTRLASPYVVTISEPGEKLYTADAALLQFLEVSINVSDLLPDAVIADVGHTVDFWFIEAVNTDGEINEDRKTRLLDWAARQGIDPDRCSFLTAFSSRNDPPARKRLKDLAAGTFAYFADEPGHELAWYALATREAANTAAEN